MRRSLLVPIALAVLTGCDASTPGVDGGVGDGARGAMSDMMPARDGAGAMSDMNGGGPHVAVTGGTLLVDGQPTYLFGGDLHYFRVRDHGFDAQATQALWSDTMDRLQAAGLNLVTTYAPWDYHNPSDGVWDFSGARDLGAFLQMACDHHLWVVLKPGPLITGEWPRGFGTYGAVPAWWKQAHPEALVLKSDGSTFRYGPLGAADQTQPSYLHPTYLAAVADWYHHVLDVARPFLDRCLVGIQVDNETNLYWSNRFGDVDYSPTALSFYAQWLQNKYGTIASLNQAYGTSYPDFPSVTPPSSAPSGTDRSKNVWTNDWYDAGEAMVGEYLSRLRAMIEAEGYREPDVAFFTNDSPFALTVGPVLAYDVLLHDGATKAPIGIPSLDLYPKQSVMSSTLTDQPFQADYFTRLYELYRDPITGRQGYAYAAELQGGFYSLPVVGAPDVRPEATDQLLARTVGHGLRGGSFYVIRGGLNADNSDYDYQAAIALDGTERPRLDVIRRWGGFLAREGTSLLGAEEVGPSVALVTNARYARPVAGVLDEMQLLHTVEMPALYGWLASAGLAPAVLDAEDATPQDLAAYRVVFYQDPDFVDAATADLLAGYVAQGGVLVQLLWPGRLTDEFQASAATDWLSSTLYPATSNGDWAWPTTSRSGDFNVSLGGMPEQAMTSYWYESFWSAPSGSAIAPFAWERKAFTGSDGSIVGYTVSDGNGTRAFLGTNVYSAFNRGDYYAMDDATWNALAALARQLALLGGEAPLVETGAPHELVWARRAAGRIYLFVTNDTGASQTVHVAIDDATRLGLDGARTYAITEGLSQAALPSQSGAYLAATGIDVDVAAWSAAVLVVVPQ